MKQLTTILLLILSLNARATNYYVNASGNDAAAGTIGAPWQTIGKVNSSMASMTSGDAVYFNRGNSFFGVIIITKSGITFDAYGTGAQPIITGLLSLSGWSDIGSGKFQSNVTVAKNSLRIFTINGKAYDYATTPNSGYLTYTNSSASMLKSTSLSGAPTYTGADVIYRANAYRTFRGRITAHAADSINFRTTGTIDPNGSGLALTAGTSGYGFKIINHSSCLDQYGEWLLDTSSKRIITYGDLTGATVKYSAIDTLVRAGNYTDLTFRNLNFEGAGHSAIYTASGSNINVSFCNFSNCLTGVFAYNSGSIAVTDSRFTNIFSQSIGIVDRQRENITIQRDTILYNGMLLGLGITNYNNNMKAITVETDTDRVANTNTIAFNRIDTVGSVAIEFQGSNITVEGNSGTSYSNIMSDAGFIYSWYDNSKVTPTKTYYNRVVRNNIMSGGVGAPAGTATNEPDVVGIYMDDGTANTLIYGNTISDVAGPGMQFNNTSNIKAYNNTIFNCAIGINANRKDWGTFSGLSITRNAIIPTNVNQFNFLVTDNNLDSLTLHTMDQTLSNFAFVDSNTIATPRLQGFKYYYSAKGVSYIFPTPLTATQWRGYGHDLASTYITPTGAELFVNETAVPKKITFTGQRYQNVITPGIYDDYVWLGPYEGIIVVGTGSKPASNQIFIKGYKFVNQ